MIDYIEQAASQYKDGGLFETAVLVYKVQTHILADSLDYSALAVLHGHIRSMYQLAMAAESGQARMLGTYCGWVSTGSFSGLGSQRVCVQDAEDHAAGRSDGFDAVPVEAPGRRWPGDRGCLHRMLSIQTPWTALISRSRRSNRTWMTTRPADDAFPSEQQRQLVRFREPVTRSGGLTQSSIDEQWVRRTVLAVATPFLHAAAPGGRGTESSETAPVRIRSTSSTGAPRDSQGGEPRGGAVQRHGADERCRANRNVWSRSSWVRCCRCTAELEVATACIRRSSQSRSRA